MPPETTPPPDVDAHLRTDHLLGDLGGRALRGGTVMLAAQVVRFVLRLGAMVVLSRLLPPCDFGLVAMVTAITGFAALFQDLGLSTATVQQPDLQPRQVSTLFWMNCAAGAMLGVLTAVSAPLIAAMYGDPRLVEITVALAGTFVIAGVGVQHLAILNRQMRFTALAAIALGALLLGTAVSVLLALLGLGYWALVAMPLVTTGATTVAAWVVQPWRPSRPGGAEGLGGLLRFGGGLIGFKAVNYVARNADKVLLGLRWGTAPLGLYSRAYQMLLMPLSQIVSPLTSVALSTLSKLRSEPDRFSRSYLSALTAVQWITCPIVAALAACGEELFGLLLGQAWVEAGGIFRLLAPAAVIQPLYSSVGWVLLSLGQAGRMLRLSLVVTPVLVGAAILALPYGPRGVALATSSAMVLVIVPWSLFYSYSQTPVRARATLGASMWPLAASAVAFSVTMAVRFALPIATGWGALSASVGAGVLVTVGLSMLLSPARAQILEIMSFVKRLRERAT